MEEFKKQYMIDYESFMNDSSGREVTGEEIGRIISILAQHFATTNISYFARRKALNKIAAIMVSSTDDNNGKPISVSKADILIRSTDESDAVEEVKTDLENIDQYINALKYLQRGVLTEYSHMTSQ